MTITSKIFTFAAAGLLAVSAQAGVAPASPFDAASHIYKPRNSRSLNNSERSLRIAEINAMMQGKRHMRHASEVPADIKPSMTLGPVSTFGDIDGPDGEVWFYTMDVENRAIEHEYYTEYTPVAFTINVYNGKYEHIGTVNDDIDYADDETRVPLCSLLPSITKNFFNTDDKYEIVVGLAFNTDVPGIMRYRSAVYSLGNEKGSDGKDKIVYILPDLVCDVLDATQPGGPENIYMSTMTEYFPTDIPEDGTPEMWEFRLAQKVQLNTYAKVNDKGEVEKILSHDICHQNLPGDQEYTPFLLSVSDNGKPYIAFSQYKETLFNPYYSSSEDVTQRENNSLLIEVYELGSTATKVQTTEIAFEKDKIDGVIGSFYSIGDLRYRGDVLFADGKVNFIVSKGNKIVANDETLERSYYVYNADGSRKAILFEGSESTMEIGDIPGHEPQQLFIDIFNDEYIFHFVDLESAKEVAKFSYLLTIDGSDPDVMTSNLDRYPVGDSYMYALEMRYPVEEDDNAIMRVAWVKPDGTFSHMDEINMGAAVQYAQLFLDTSVLDPTTFLSDSHREYMMLIKRGQSDGTNTEELLIGQARNEDYPEGRDVFVAKPDAERGNLASIIPYSISGVPSLAVSYVGDNKLTVDYYTLPFDGTQGGVGDIAGGASSISFEGGILTADGTITVYTVSGMLAASAEGSLNTLLLPKGTYIACAGKDAIKIIVK